MQHRAGTKQERREEYRHKQRHAATGGGFAAQAKREQVNKGYQGLAKGVKKRIVAKTKLI